MNTEEHKKGTLGVDVCRNLLLNARLEISIIKHCPVINSCFYIPEALY